MSTQQCNETIKQEFGYSCPCGAWHPAGLWAAAHWDEQLLTLCEQCQTQHTIQSGRILRSRKQEPTL